MSDEDLTQLLERAADDLPVGPVPLAAVHAQVGRRTRRRRARIAVLTSAAAVAAVIGGTFALVPHRSDHPVATPPTKTRLFGIGHVAAEVPASWATNDMRCGFPQQDTVVLGGGPVLACIAPHPANTEMISFQRYYGEAQLAGSVKLLVDDHEVYGTGIDCSTIRSQCSMTVVFAAQHVLVTLSSSTSRATVQTMLGWIKVLPDHVAVPAPGEVISARSGDLYVRLLESEGFKPVKKIDFNATEPTGLISQVAPAPGSVLKPGSTVEFTVTSRLRSAAHHIRLSLSVDNPGAPTFTIADAKIRVSADATTALGARITLFVRGRPLDAIHVTSNNAFLAPSTSPTKLPENTRAFVWTPVHRGRTALVIYETANGEHFTFGVVRLNIR